MVTGTMLLVLAGGIGAVVAVVLAVVSRRTGRARAASAERMEAWDPEQAAALRDIQSQIDRGRGPLG